MGCSSQLQGELGALSEPTPPAVALTAPPAVTQPEEAMPSVVSPVAAQPGATSLAVECLVADIVTGAPTVVASASGVGVHSKIGIGAQERLTVDETTAVVATMDDAGGVKSLASMTVTTDTGAEDGQ